MRYIASFRFHSSSANGSQLLFASIRNFFFFSPDPLLPALTCLRASNNPPPPGRGTCQPVSVRSSHRRYNPPASSPTRPLTHSVRSLLLAIVPVHFSVRFCLLPLVPALFRPSAAFRSSSRRPIRKAGSGFRFAGSLLLACLNRHGKGGAGMPSCRFLPVPPVSPFRLPCLLAAFSFPYLPGMVMGYSVATVIYFS